MVERARVVEHRLYDLFARREAAERGPADTQLTPEQLTLQNMLL